MNTHDLILQALQYLIEAGITVLIPFVIRFLLAHTSKENLAKYTQLAETVVMSIEQTMGAGNGAAKKAAAEAKLAQLLKGALSAEDIDHLIESAVFQMNKIWTDNVKTTPVAPEVTK